MDIRMKFSAVKQRRMSEAFGSPHQVVRTETEAYVGERHASPRASEKESGREPAGVSGPRYKEPI